jgi:CBS domain-containing protein
MTSVIIAVPSGLDAELAWRELRTARIHHLVVIDDGRIVGVLSDRDLGGSGGSSLRAGKCVADLMTSSVVIAAPEMTVRDAAKLMRGRSVGCLPVLDGKTLVGIVTSSDVLALVGRGSKPAPDERRRLHDRGPNSRTYATAPRTKDGGART